MSDIGAKVAELIAAGCAPDVAARVVAEAYVAGVEAAAFRGNSTGVPVDEVAEKRRAYDRARKRKSTGIPPESTGTPRNSESVSLSIEKKEENNKEEREAVSEPFHRKSNRGARLPPDWEPQAPDLTEAALKLGSQGSEIELAKFHDYWKAQPGQRGVKLDWDATWRNWIRNARPANGTYPAKPLTQHQLDRQESREILNDLQKFIDASSGSGDADLGLLRFDTGDGQESVHGGVRRTVVDLPVSRSREGS